MGENPNDFAENLSRTPIHTCTSQPKFFQNVLSLSASVWVMSGVMPTTIIDRLDGEGAGYIDNPMSDLYNEDFLWGTAIQTACIQSEHRVLQPKRDRVLDCLITLGVQNTSERCEPGMSTRGRSIATSLEMHHASSISSWLLGCIAVLEKEVGELVQHICQGWCLLTVRWTPEV